MGGAYFSITGPAFLHATTLLLLFLTPGGNLRVDPRPKPLLGTSEGVRHRLRPAGALLLHLAQEVAGELLRDDVGT